MPGDSIRRVQRIALVGMGRSVTSFLAEFLATSGVFFDRNGNLYWAVKDPRLTILHSLWLPEIDIVVGIFRDPLQVVASYLKLAKDIVQQRSPEPIAGKLRHVPSPELTGRIGDAFLVAE